MYYSGAPFAFKENKNVRSLLAYISKKGFSVGDKLPPERELAEQLGISLSSANRMLAKLRTYWDDPLFVRSGFLMQPTTAAKRRYDKVLSLMHVLEDLRRDDELDPRTLSRTVRTIPERPR